MSKLTIEQETALIAFARQHGRHWKLALNLRWASCTAGQVLQGVRNQFGPSWLAKYQVPADTFMAID